MKKKNYVYRLMCSRVDYADLKTAVEDAYASIRDSALATERISSPYVLKVQGGYQVSVFNNYGSVYRRKIDVFEPCAKSRLVNKVKVHNVRANKTGKNPYDPDSDYFTLLQNEDESDDECDFNCDECDNAECEDRMIDEDEGE